MGQSKQRKNAFKQEHPRCIFCGGERETTTEEHCPPRALFNHKHWPEGFVFPSCEPCNNGTSNDDAIVALLARMDPMNPERGADERIPGLMLNVHNQGNGFLLNMFNVSTRQARNAMRRLNMAPAPGQLRRHSGVVNVPARADDAVIVLARKLTKALFYRATGRPFPVDGDILFNWFTNATLLEHGEIPALMYAAQFRSESIPTVRSGINLANQFDCRISLSPDNNLLIVQALFGATFGFVTAASSTPRLLSDINARWIAQEEGSLFRSI
ncbi:hypothetical protein [Herbaspirillum seropedicae]